MGSRYEVEVTVESARDLKNVNWRNGDLMPYAVLWIDGSAKSSTRVDIDGDANPTWDDKLLIPLPPSSRIEDAVLFLDVVHANAADGIKPLVGSACLPLRNVIDEVGIGGRTSSTLRLKRPSGRPQGLVDVRVAVREPARYYETAYGQPTQYRDYEYAGSYAQPYAYGGEPRQYGAAAPAPPGYPPYGYAPQDPFPAYGASAAPTYGEAAPAQDQKKGSGKMGMGAGLAIGAVAGVLGGVALAEGASYLENKFEDHVTEKVEDKLEDDYGEEYGGGRGRDDDFDGGDDDD